MTWTVEILAEALPELNSLPVGMRARFGHITRLIVRFGLEQVKEPHVKHLQGSLWEIRLTGKAGIARALFVTANGKRLVVVRVFRKKSQKTPRREIW